MPMSRRNASTSTPGPVMRSPCTSISPSSIDSRPLIQRSSVDFPDPDGPIRLTTSCSPTVIARRLMTGTSPYDFEMSRMSMNDMASPSGFARAHTRAIAPHHPLDEARLRNRYDDEQQRHRADGGQIVVVRRNQHRLIERIDHAHHRHQRRIFLQRDKSIEQRRDDLPDALRNYHET